jgi:hypothetical protein
VLYTVVYVVLVYIYMWNGLGCYPSTETLNPSFQLSTDANVNKYAYILTPNPYKRKHKYSSMNIFEK